MGTRREEDGITVIRIPRKPWNWRLGRLPVIGKHMLSLRLLIYAANLAFTLKKIARAESIDWVEYADVNAEGFWHNRFLSSLPYSVRLQTPLYVMDKFYTENEKGGTSYFFIGAMERYAIRHANLLISPSHSMAEIIAASCNIPVASITRMPNPLDEEYASGEYPPKQMNFPQDTVLYLGRLEKRKGAYVFAGAIPQVVKKYPNAKFVFAGPDRRSPSGQSTREEITDLLLRAGVNLEKNSFLGQVTRSQLKACYSEATIVVIPTLYEDYPYAVIEAMASGAAVIASDCYGIPEIIDHNHTGVLFKTNDGADLATQILNLLLNSDLRIKLAKMGKEYILSECNPRRIATLSVENYKAVISDHFRIKSK